MVLAGVRVGVGFGGPTEVVSPMVLREPWSSTCASYSLLVSTRSGTVESRLRRLVGDLDYTSDIDLAHPYVKQYDLQIKDLAPEEFTSLLSDNVSKATLKRATVLTGESAPVAAANGAVEEGGEKKVDSTDTEVPNSAFITVFYIGLKINQAGKGSHNDIRT